MRIAILVVDGVYDSGLALLRDVFTAANLLAERVDPHLDRFEVSLRGCRPELRTEYGLTVAVEPLEDLEDAPVRHLLVPSLGFATPAQIVARVGSSPELPLLRAAYGNGTAVAGACSGAFLLAEAGLLDGRDATTSWWLGPTFRARYPHVLLDESRALVVSGTTTTAGAALAHVDLALSLVQQLSPQLAEAISDYLAVGDRPTQGSLIRHALLPGIDPVLSAFDRAVREGLAGSLDVGALAAEIGVSQRTLQRLTSTTLGLTPVRYIQQVRLERAISLLRTTDHSVSAVAHAVGYQDASTLGTLMRRRRGTTPDQIRRRAVGPDTVDVTG